jgi:soluble lytic murein transglycosylase-like protein
MTLVSTRAGRGRPHRRRAGRAGKLGAAAWLAVAALACPEAAAADVLELGVNGAVIVRASDRSIPAVTTAGPELVGDVVLPAEAFTPEAASTAPTAYAGVVAQVADAHGISPALLEALVWQESRWRAGARSTAGAIGLAQLMPATARELGVDPRDPTSNLAGGARYLRQQLDRFDGDIERALAAYNAGPGRVLRAGGIPMIAETQNYVRSVVDRLSGAATLQGKRP